MTLTGISTAASVGAFTPSPPAVNQHRHGQFRSLSDIDAQSSSVASAPSSTGKTGSKVDITA